ncbi:hypothetical protein PENSPDRAFT_733366 [Peniophora sp. CONT]|nr:hypothetical protein PENSPDRAFT_733366 [Peniophora sp. CONT]
MGLFTKKNKDHSAAHDSNEPLEGTRHDAHTARVGGAGAHSNAYDESGGLGATHGRDHVHQQDGIHQGSGQYANNNTAGRGAGQGQPLAHGGQQQPLGGGSAFAEPGLAPTNHISQQPGHSHGGGSKAAVGKAESAIGGVIGSSALKNRGLEKEQEANAIKAQSAELAEAERLEREAMLRRERAVAHGAHPENRHLGGQTGTAALDERRAGM